MDFSEYPFNVLIRNVDLGILLALTFVSWEPGFEPSALDDEIVAHNYVDQGAVVVVKSSCLKRAKINKKRHELAHNGAERF